MRSTCGFGRLTVGEEVGFDIVTVDVGCEFGGEFQNTLEFICLGQKRLKRPVRSIIFADLLAGKKSDKGRKLVKVVRFANVGMAGTIQSERNGLKNFANFKY